MKRPVLFLTAFFINILLAGAVTQERELFAQAESRYFAGNYSLALEEYNTFLRLYPLSHLVPDAHYRRAICFFRLGKYPESLQLLEKIEKRYRTTRYLDYVPFWQGMIFYYQKEYIVAIQRFAVFLQQAQEQDLAAQALYYQGLSQVLIDDYTNACYTIEKLVQNNIQSPLYPQAVVLLAFIYLKQNNYNAIMGLAFTIDSAALTQELQEKFNLYQASAFWGLGRYNEARIIYEGLLEKSPSIATVALARLFMLAQQENNLQEMERLLEIAEQQFSSSPGLLLEFWTNIGIVSYNQGNYDLAKHYLQRVWNYDEKQVTEPAVPLYLSEIYIRENDIKSALSILTRYISISGNSSGTLILRLGDLYLQANEYTEAARVYNQFIEQNPESGRIIEVFYYLIFAYYKSGDTDKAYNLSQDVMNNIKIGPWYKEHLKLYVNLLRQKQELARAAAVLKDYLQINNHDWEMQKDYLKLLFTQKKYNEIITVTDNILKSSPALKSQDYYTYLFVNYLNGLSHIAEKSYSQALISLSRINTTKARQAGLEIILPYTMFYKAWAFYRLDNFKQAAVEFTTYIEKYPGHELFAQSLYLAGWCYYSLGQYDQANRYFNILTKQGNTDELTTKALFFTGKSYVNLGKQNDALAVFNNIFTNLAQSAMADDARFEYSHILAEQGKYQEAAASYLKLFTSFPNSPLAPEALYKRGELYFKYKAYAEARSAFYNYRINFPRGNVCDAALYWEGLSSWELGEKFGAVLLWDRIIAEYGLSPFRADAMIKTAEVYTQSGSYTKAMDLYSLYKSQYPAEADALQIEQYITTLRYLILGLSDKEAELTTIIEREKGVKTTKGRAAMLELAWVYLAKQDTDNLILAYNLLIKVLAVKEDVQTLSQAQFLLGDYYYLSEDYIKAGNEYVKAAVINPQDRDLMALSIFRAAEMMVKAGDHSTARELVQRLENNFPSSEWAEEGKKLLKALP